MSDYETVSRKVFRRMEKAHKTGKGVRITHEELEALNLTFLGEVWANEEFDHALPQATSFKSPTYRTIDKA